MTPTSIRNQKLAQTVIKNLERRHFEAYYCGDSAEAVSKILELIPPGSEISWGGSMTIRDMGLTEALHRGPYRIYDRDKEPDPSKKKELYRKAFSCDYFISSVNAISRDGVIVNIDGNGNRVAALAYGPDKVILVAGMNKVTPDCHTAIARARGTAATINACRFDIDTPCKVDGACHDCNSPQSICNQIHILRNSFPAKRHIVILVDENLGY